MTRIAYVVRRSAGTVSIRCPFCRGEHIHGDPTGGELGHRVAHCGRSGYYIVDRSHRPRPAPLRAEIDALMVEEFGATVARYGTPKRFYSLRTGPCCRIVVEVDVYGELTTAINMERIFAAAAPESAREWLDEHVLPYVQAWMRESRDGANVPGAGHFAGSNFRSRDALEVLRLWVPRELAWQRQIDAEALLDIESEPA